MDKPLPELTPEQAKVLMAWNLGLVHHYHGGDRWALNLDQPAIIDVTNVMGQLMARGDISKLDAAHMKLKAGYAYAKMKLTQ